jgi:hypothetical protein
MLWYLVAVSAVMGCVAVGCGSWKWMLASAVCYFPFCAYLGLTPRFYYVWIGLVFFYVAIHAIRRTKRGLAALSLLPVAAFTVWIAVFVGK